jgi:hypothetical protein
MSRTRASTRRPPTRTDTPSFPSHRDLILKEDETETACRICGYDDGETVFNEYGVPQYVVCPCCYNESGIGDDNVSQIRELRG